MNSVYFKFILHLFNASMNGILILVCALFISAIKNRISAQIKTQVLLISIAGLIALFTISVVPKNLNFLRTQPTYSVLDLNDYAQSDVTYQSKMELKKMTDSFVTQKYSYEQVKDEGNILLTVLINWPAYAFVLWFIGFIWVIMGMLFGLLATFKLKKNAVPVEGGKWIEYLDWKELIQVRQSVQIFMHEANFSPLTFGFLNAIIILPSEAIYWSKERRSIALLHELIHIKNADFIKNLIIKLTCAIFWFNPIVWIAAKRYRFEQEAACDDQVVNCGVKPHIYAKELLDLTRICRPLKLANTLVSPMSIGKRSHTEKRIIGILSSSKPQKAFRRWYVILSIIMMMSLSMSTYFFNFVKAQEQLQSNEVPSLWPLQEGEHQISSFFGEPIMDGTETTKINRGVNISWSGKQINIYASADGIVNETGVDTSGHVFIIIQHKHGLETYYGNLCNNKVAEGSTVVKGDLIGISTVVGSIHFEIRKGDEVIDPLLMIQGLPSSYVAEGSR